MGLVRVTNDLLVASDNGLVSILVLLDLSAPFDTIDRGKNLDGGLPTLTRNNLWEL